MNRIEGDLLKLAGQGHFDVIIHGCNCFCTMGAGIAKAIRDQFPAAYEADLATEKGSREKLGSYSSAEVAIDDHLLTVVNAYTQFNYRGAGVKADYDAIRKSVWQSQFRLQGQTNRLSDARCGIGWW